MPVFLECQRCTACCRWLGQVRLTVTEIARPAAFKRLDESDLIRQFTRLTSDRRGLALMDKPNGECDFLDGDNCVAQPAEPQQCRDFPNLWNFPGAKESCRAQPRGVADAEHVRLVALASNRSPDAVNMMLNRAKEIRANPSNSCCIKA